MKKGIIILAVVLIIALYVLNKVSTARQLEFTVALPRNVSLRGGSLTFDLPLKAQNVSGGSIRIKSADFDVLAGTKFLGKAIVPTQTTITPRGATELIVKVNISYFDLLTATTSFVNMFRAGTVNLTLDGLVYAEGFQFPVRQSFDFPLPKL